MDSSSCKRVSVKPKVCPNPLFRKWLTEWKNEAKEKGSDMKYVYSKALASLNKYPLVLKSGRECAILQHFGVKLCSMLDKKLAEHNQSQIITTSVNSGLEAIQAIIPTSRKVIRPAQRKRTQPERELREETVIYEAGSFRVQLFVDSGETNGFKLRGGPLKGSHKDVLLNQLTTAGVPFEVRKLSVGDFAWGCIPDSLVLGSTASAKMDEKILMLPYIVERKRVDDLGSSIRDGRFHEQKFRLKKSGMWQKIYLIEGISEKLGVADKDSSRGLHLPISTLQQASANTEVVDRFIVKDTKGLKETAQYLAMMTNSLTMLFQGKKLMLCKKEDLPQFSVHDDELELMSLSEFNKSSIKCKDLTVSQMFVRQLLQIRGLSVEKAQAIVDKYPTPSDLCRAYSDEPAEKQIRLANIPFGPNRRMIGPTLSKVLSDLYSNETIK
ncbi:crossover junction endonuclease MUS81 isoform X2 [Ischnura elegans]|uniref:crossover junction endonuclease MUS81 isoform X2 n=1 Tax=Ischnura elegans TaxID=197161 RepID=UPI001ED883F0|nr:crossover junction endonuclease MUS81 isoform X2 [Ischnura elegans]